MHHRQIHDGKRGAYETLDAMARIAVEGSYDPRIRIIAINLTDGLQQKDYASEACAILTFVRDRIRYIRDFATAELLQPPQITLCLNAGDCDDKCILLASLLLSVGHHCRYVAISQNPEEFTHVWLQSNVYGKWVDLEPTEPIPYGTRVPSSGVVQTITKEIGG